MNDAILNTSGEPDVDLTVAEYAVRAKCLIKTGDVCTVYCPGHHDFKSCEDHVAYHEQNAQIVKLHGDGTLDIKITSGVSTGEIVVHVNPMNLFFWGPFTSQ